jgi:hypothetical protein
VQEKKLKEIILVGSSHAHERTDSQLSGDPQLFPEMSIKGLGHEIEFKFLT